LFESNQQWYYMPLFVTNKQATLTLITGVTPLTRIIWLIHNYPYYLILGKPYIYPTFCRTSRKQPYSLWWHFTRAASALILQPQPSIWHLTYTDPINETWPTTPSLWRTANLHTSDSRPIRFLLAYYGRFNIGMDPAAWIERNRGFGVELGPATEYYLILLVPSTNGNRGEVSIISVKILHWCYRVSMIPSPLCFFSTFGLGNWLPFGGRSSLDP